MDDRAPRYQRARSRAPRFARGSAARCAALTAALALATGGCGSGGDERPSVDPLPFGELLAHVPTTDDVAIALDVRAARAELGLAPDAAPPVPPNQGNDGERRLRGLVAATVLNYPIKDNGPLDRAIDYHQVTGLARVDGPPGVVLIATRQSWRDLRKRFERSGWHDRGDGLLERPAGGRALRWVTGRDGFAVAAGDPRAALLARDRRAREGEGLLPLLQAAGGASRGARLGGRGCIRGVAVGYSPAAAGGRFVVAVRDVPPLPYRLRPLRGAYLPDGMTTSTAVAAGGRVIVPFSFEATTDPTRQPAFLALASASRFAYACRGGG